MCSAWQIGAAASECDDATWPSIATTWSWWISLLTTVPASSGLDWSSSTRSLIFWPRMPPFWLTPSKASSEPCFVEMPKVAMPPVSEPYSPIRISFCVFFEPQDTVAARTAARQAAASARNLMVEALLVSDCGKTAYCFAATRGCQNILAVNALGRARFTNDAVRARIGRGDTRERLSIERPPIPAGRHGRRRTEFRTRPPHPSTSAASRLAVPDRSGRAQGPVPPARRPDSRRYLVGGSVRDLLLSRVPKDFDIGTDAHPAALKSSSATAG